MSTPTIDKISNLLLLHIISKIDDNVDIRLIQFKGIRVIDDKGRCKSKQFQATATQFKLLSFKDILENSISDQQVILSDEEVDKRYPKWIQQRISASAATRVDKSNITTALVMHNTLGPTVLNIACRDIPSIETLIINDHDYQNDRNTVVIDLDSISQLPNLQRLVVSTKWLNRLGHHPSRKTLELNVDTRQYTPIELGLSKFLSLTELKFKSYCVSSIGGGGGGRPDPVFPSSLTSLTLRPTEIPAHYYEEEDLRTTISVPPSLKILTIWSHYVHIPHECTMPLLENLNVTASLLTDGNISLLSSKSIKKLYLKGCYKTIPPNIIPPSVQRVTFDTITIEDKSLDNVIFPPCLTHLSIIGEYYHPVWNLPPSLVKLKQRVDKVPSTLPQHLEKLAWGVFETGKSSQTDLQFPSSYPPHLEMLDFYNVDGPFTLDNIPPIIKHLKVQMTRDRGQWPYPKLFSIGSMMSKRIISQSPSELWLPQNTTHLTCNFKYFSENAVFRLDQVINHTNVRSLSIIIQDNTYYSDDHIYTFQFSIQRLDTKNRNVLVLETQTLQGGIITQKSNNNQQQQQQQQQLYDPIYLYFDLKIASSSYELKWSFEDRINDPK
ncbi:hypothetical protein DFA_02554 [Cavenderia fasciculata]|uniref:Uncharacterized protein n=1 Tax=Cavenderia fasciculata TaxID=261658 RepID=F4PZQ1_CACFS|nr:uncharacterized protein DFA_02554 [Cavenderia fasciculata]EGG18815.1 hypothetical protein DFA_02554 [Cavenderia fasciculata]|eukprot:XP_004357277.1 hypothetical protein DFA_02554 [Cavenderia fasciculata]